MMLTSRTLRSWWRAMLHPARSRVVLAGAMELAGIGLVLYGLYRIHPLAFIIVAGITCIVLAQGLATGGDES